MSIALVFLLMWFGLAPPEARASHGDTHTPINTVITSDSASVKFTWIFKSTGLFFGDSRTVYSQKAYDTVRLLSSVDVTANLETAYIRPTDSYIFVKHIRNLGNGYDTFRVRGDSTANFVTGLFTDISDGDSLFDATDLPPDSVVVKDLTETVVLVRVQAAATAIDGAMDTLRFSATSTDTQPSAETVTLVLTVDSQPPTLPNPLTPDTGLETTSQRPVFTWSASTDTRSGLGYYLFELDTSGTFINLVLADTRTTTSFTPAANLAANLYYWRVRARDTVGNITNNIDSSRVRVDTGVKVSLVSPAAGHETNTVSVRFDWSTSDNAETYTWQLSKTSTFTSITDSAVDTSVTNVTKTLPYEDTFYWRVIGRDRAGNFDTTASRIILLDTSVNKVVLVSPAPASSTADSTPTLTWTALADSVGIDSYVIEVSAHPAFATIAFTDTVDGVRTSDTTSALTDSTYYWRVRGIDDLGNVGQNSDSFQLRIQSTVSVTLTSPAAGHETTNAAITFAWSATGAETYTWQLSKTSTFIATLADSVVDTTATSVTRPIPGEDTFYWRVIGKDAAGNMDTAVRRGFVLDTSVGQVSLVSPADGHETTAAQPVVSWSAVADSVGIDSYAVEVSRLSTFASLVFNDTLDGIRTSDTLTGLYNDSYYWRVRAIDNLRNNGLYSAARGFVIDTLVGQVSIVSPADGHETNNARVVVSWSALPDSVGIDSYAVEVSKLTTFVTLVFKDTVDGVLTSDTLSGLYNDTYYWRVRGIDNRGNVGANAASLRFRVDTDAMVTLTAPAAGFQTRTETITFDWSASNADTYTWQLSKSSTFATILFANNDTTVKTFSRVVSGEDTFYWRVLGKDALGNTDSKSQGFIIDQSVGAVTVTAPADRHETSNSRPVVTWTAITTDSVGIDSYVVEASKVSTFTGVVFTDTVDAIFTTDTLSGLYNDTYFWRVRAVDNVGNVGTSVNTLKFLVDTGVDTVTLDTPLNGATTSNTKPSLNWIARTDSVAISSYAVEVSKTSTFTTLVFADTVAGTTTTDSITTTLTQDTYYWRVRAKDTVGNVGANSSPFFFLVDTGVSVSLVAPSSGHETGATTVTFVWRTLDDAETFTWQFSKSAVFASISDSVVDTTATNVTKNLTVEDTYYWRVIGKDRNGNQDTQSRGFVLDTHAGQVSLLAPADLHDTSNAALVVSWSALSDSVGIDSYAVEVARTTAFAVLIFKDTIAGVRTSDTLTGLSTDTYYWRVRAIDHVGNAGASSSSRSFRIDKFVDSVSLLAPSDRHDTSNVRLVVSWNLIAADTVGIDSYVVMVSKSKIFTSLVFLDTVDSVRSSDTLSGLYNDTYYWRVIGVDNLGNNSDTAEIRSFLVDTEAGQVTLTSPADSTVTADTTPTFIWTTTTDSVGVDSHVIEVSSTAAFTNIKFVDTIDGSISTDTARPFLAEDTYYWRVIAIDNLGNTVASKVSSFIVDTSAPYNLTLVSPINGHETTNLKPLFKWSAASDTRSGIRGYRLELARDTTFAILVLATDTVPGSSVETAPAFDLAQDTYYWRVIAIDNAGNTVASLTSNKIAIASTAASLTWDQTEYKGLRVFGQVRLIDPLANISPFVKDVADVTIFSDADPVGFTLTLEETDNNTGLFVNPSGSLIQFTGGMTNAASKKIKVNPGSGLTAKRVQTNGSIVIGSARWLNEAGAAPPSDVTKTRTWPNPWNPTTGEPMIFQNLPADPGMTIGIYTLDMKLIRTLYNGSGITASSFGNTAQWDGKNDAGQYVSSGVYLYIVRSQFGTTVKKITLVK